MNFIAAATTYRKTPTCKYQSRGCESTPREGNLIFFKNYDVPGVIGRIGTLLGEQQVNIANFSLGRRELAAGAPGPAKAIAVVHVDGAVPGPVLEALRRLEPVRFVRAVEIR